MNERVTFVLAAVIAELTTSVLFYLHSPGGPLCAASPSLLVYVGQHGPLALILWLLVLTGGWFYAGMRLVRPRQNLSTKLKLLAGLGVTGAVIDNAVSLYQFENSPDAVVTSTSSASLVLGLAERTLLYGISFATVVLLAYLVSRTQKSSITPPPRFGRE